MLDTDIVPSRGDLSFTWVFCSAIFAAVAPLLLSPFYLVYCIVVYDFLPIIGSEGWFLSHFFGGFGLYYKWSAVSSGAIYLLGQLLILISPMAALKTAASINAVVDVFEPFNATSSYSSSAPRGRVWVRGHWRRK